MIIRCTSTVARVREDSGMPPRRKRQWEASASQKVCAGLHVHLDAGGQAVGSVSKLSMSVGV